MKQKASVSDRDLYTVGLQEMISKGQGFIYHGTKESSIQQQRCIYNGTYKILLSNRTVESISKRLEFIYSGRGTIGQNK